MRIRNGLAAALLAWALGAQAAPGRADQAVVDVVQAPAWLERGAQRRPLVPGMRLRNRDQVTTGAGARAVLQLPDGSAVKLGENAQAGLNALGRRDGGVLTAALDVTGGAFRLTTDEFRDPPTPSVVNVRVGTVTAGIRAADVWGSSDAERDFVCLFAGRSIATHPRGETVELSEPFQVYGADEGQAPGAVLAVDRFQAALWALQTELQDDAVTLRRGGRWSVRLATADTQATALAIHDRAVAAGYAPKIHPLRSGPGRYRYELRIGQLPDRRQAELLVSRLARDLELDAAGGAPAVLPPPGQRR